MSILDIAQKIHPRMSRRAAEYRWGWIFAAPAVILGSVFILLPFIMAVVMSFTNLRLISAPSVPTRFIGLDNFMALFQDADFWQALGNTGLFVLIVVPVQTSFALMLALLVNQNVRLVNFFRTTYFVPVVLPMVVVATVWGFLYTYNPAPGGSQGLVNAFLGLISGGHLGPFAWTLDPHVALLAIIILSIWQGVGFQMIIFLAGLQEIPAEMYEASSMDGANGWQQFWSITLPLLRNSTIFIVLATTILAFGLFDQVNILTQGGPIGTTTTLTYFMITKGFTQLQTGYGSAVAVVFFVLVVIITLLQRRFLREERAIEA
jgi:multiple sugar transport system permease protein